MAYKKYIRRGGKTYGPYTYESKRVGDKVVTNYVGKDTKKEIKFTVDKRLFFIIPALALVLLMFFLTNLTPTGRVALKTSPSYVEGEALSGNFNLILKHGELIPADSEVKVTLGGQENVFLLSELVQNELVSSNFYIENIKLNDSGDGFGIIGEKKLYPEVEFKLFIIEKTNPVNEKDLVGEEPIYEIQPAPNGVLENGTKESSDEVPEGNETQKDSVVGNETEQEEVEAPEDEGLSIPELGKEEAYSIQPAPEQGIPEEGKEII